MPDAESYLEIACFLLWEFILRFMFLFTESGKANENGKYYI